MLQTTRTSSLVSHELKALWKVADSCKVFEVWCTFTIFEGLGFNSSVERLHNNAHCWKKNIIKYKINILKCQVKLVILKTGSKLPVTKLHTEKQCMPLRDCGGNQQMNMANPSSMYKSIKYVSSDMDLDKLLFTLYSNKSS